MKTELIIYLEKIMLPLIAVPVLGLVWTFKPKCIRCNSRFTLNSTCIICKELVCQECGTYFDEVIYKGFHLLNSSHCCNIHTTKRLDLIAEVKVKTDQEIAFRFEQQRRREYAELKMDQVIVYSKRYYGHKEPVRLGKTIKTPFFDDKDIALKELKIIAAMHDCFIAHELQEHSYLKNDGNYSYKTWSYSGVI